MSEEDYAKEMDTVFAVGSLIMVVMYLIEFLS